MDEAELAADLPRKPADEDAFDRLPEEVKQATLEKRREKERQAAAYRERLKRRRIKGTVSGAVGSCALGLAIDASAGIFLLAITAAGAGSGLFLGCTRAGHMTGMLVYGGSALAVTIITSACGIMHTDPFMFFCSWLFFIGIGAGLGFWMEQERTLTDSF